MYGNGIQACATSCAEVDYAELMAKSAKFELLREKVKQRIDKQQGKELDKIADLVVDAISQKAKTSEELEKKRQQLASAFEELGG
ncbi:MAG: hypothetical protein Q8R15_04845 [Candidatus Micrarchaeota archaeon]|nr:hypothetical protein [Candidatus Micrarchaeota archaeon]